MERQSARVQAAGAYGADTSPGGCAVLYVSGNTDVCVCVFVNAGWGTYIPREHREHLANQIYSSLVLKLRPKIWTWE